MSACLSLAQQQFPGWRVGWWENTYGPRVGVEVSKRIAPKRYARHFWAGAAWDEVRVQLEGPRPQGGPEALLLFHGASRR